MDPASSTPNFIVLNELAGNKPATLDALQAVIAPYVDVISAIWFAVWLTVAVIVLRHLIREIREERKKN